MQERNLFVKGECREKEMHGLLLGNSRALKGVSSRNASNQGILGTNFAYFTHAEQQSDMDATECVIFYPSLLLPSTNAGQSCVHIVGHLMHLIHFTNKATVVLLDYHFSLVLGVCLQGLFPHHTQRPHLYPCSAVICEGTKDKVEYMLPEVTRGVMLQLQKAICP